MLTSKGRSRLQRSRLAGGAAEGAPRPDALTVAIRLKAFPTLANGIRQAPLPTSMLPVIRIAGGCETSLAAARQTTGLAGAELVEACRLLLMLLLSAAGTDPRRLLCVEPSMPAERGHEHMVWLLKWLHPDRSDTPGQAALAAKVLAAWREVRGSEPAAVETVSTPPDSGADSSRPVRSRWRAIPVAVQQARADETERWRRLRSDVEEQLRLLRAKEALEGDAE